MDDGNNDARDCGCFRVLSDPLVKCSVMFATPLAMVWVGLSLERGRSQWSGAISRVDASVHFCWLSVMSVTGGLVRIRVMGWVAPTRFLWWVNEGQREHGSELFGDLGHDGKDEALPGRGFFSATLVIQGIS